MQVVGRDVEQHGHLWREPDGGRKLVRRDFGHGHRRCRRPPRPPSMYRPMLPTAFAFMPAARSRCATRAVTVVLPFVPVMATQRLSTALSRQANSTSPMISALHRAALRYSKDPSEECRGWRCKDRTRPRRDRGRTALRRPPKQARPQRPRRSPCARPPPRSGFRRSPACLTR